MKTSQLVRSMAAAALAVPLATHAVEITAGTAEYVTFRDCIAGASPCDDVSPILGGAFGGSPGSYASVADVTLAGYGRSSGNVSLSGTIGAPVLRGSTTSDAGKRVNTNSLALQSYTYTGDTPTTRFFGGTLTYSQFISDAFPTGSGGESGIFAAIAAFTLTGTSVDVGSTAESNFDTLFDPLLNGTYDGETLVASNQFQDTTSTSSGMGTFGVTVALVPGETIWLDVLLQTPAADGSWIDASHTLITGWDDPSNLIPAQTSVPVPEPSMAALFGLGLASLLAARRRQD